MCYLAFCALVDSSCEVLSAISMGVYTLYAANPNAGNQNA
jgi:hypothetical protein